MLAASTVTKAWRNWRDRFRPSSSFRAFGKVRSRPDITVVTSYVGNWDDVSAGKEQALASFAGWTSSWNADAAGLGVFGREGTVERVRHRIELEPESVAPAVTLGSVVIDLPLAFLTVAREIKAGTFKPGVLELGETSRVVTLVLNPSLSEKIPAAAHTRIDSLQSLMFRGKYSITPSRDSAAVKR
jgi:basic membrane lipoprotein Med (substrate-binding protein (PBP1-ABC) superfamily)